MRNMLKVQSQSLDSSCRRLGPYMRDYEPVFKCDGARRGFNLKVEPFADSTRDLDTQSNAQSMICHF